MVFLDFLPHVCNAPTFWGKSFCKILARARLMNYFLWRELANWRIIKRKKAEIVTVFRGAAYHREALVFHVLYTFSFAETLAITLFKKKITCFAKTLDEKLKKVDSSICVICKNHSKKFYPPDLCEKSCDCYKSMEKSTWVFP